MVSLSRQIAKWVSGLSYDDLPNEVVDLSLIHISEPTRRYAK